VKLTVNVRAASKQAAFDAAKDQILAQCPAGADPMVWTGLIVNAMVPLPDDAARDVILDMDVHGSDAGDKFAISVVAELVAR
jgi:hypothetical protein